MEKPIHRKEKVRKGVVSVEDSEDELVLMVKRNGGDTHFREEGREDQGREDQGREDQGREDQGREDQGREDQGMGRPRNGKTKEWEDQGMGRPRDGKTKGWEDQGMGRPRDGKTKGWEDQGREDQGREDQGREDQGREDFDDGMGESEPGEEVGCRRSARNRKPKRIFTYNRWESCE